jgi:dTDP-4-dehydrorhamnose 3,5-epimerase
MEVRTTTLPDVLLIVPVVHGDERGFFQESYRLDALEGTPLADVRFPQENHSRSTHGVLRGMHFQVGKGIGKLVRCARGAIYDVVVDVRADSPTFGRWEGFELDDRNHHQLWVPVGLAHGFYTVSDVADVLYKQTGYYEPELERGIAWNDPDVAVRWPLDGEPQLSARDAAAPRLRDAKAEIQFTRAGTGDSGP